MIVGRYANELERAQIRSIADMATADMALKIRATQSDGNVPLYIFVNKRPDASAVTLQTANFGPWGWKIVLDELKQRGLDWEQFAQ